MTIDQVKKRILIVDDIPENARLITNMLEDICEYDLLVAMDGETCLDIVRLTKVDLILLDIMMPGMNGYEVCKVLQSDPELKNIPVIFVSAKSEVQDKIIGLEYGGVDYLTKPVDFGELRARISTHLKLADLQNSLRKSNQENLELSNQYKSLIHVMSHDLGNYLMAINGFAHLALSGSNHNDAKVEKYLGKIFDSSERVCHFLDKIKELQAMTEGKVEILLERLNVYNLLSTSVAVFQDRFDAKEIVVNMSTVDKSIEVLGDYQWLHFSVLNNVLSNALKFSDHSSKIDIYMEQDDVNLKICVQDFGVGIESARIEKVFQTNAKTSTTGTEGEKGTGFGMPLVALCMKRFNGSIELISKSKFEALEGDGNHHGTTVKLVFPVPSPTE
ncbi:MAG: hybrid sensor histidine kinase/response regulator [Candidatus Cloacimonetes bacterium]|nr:hybrid sensor histidine kinase/response regulator [Candidatus Cloacimonadota bacterium]